ncbi:hypothetical protein ACFXTN_004810 [Malus domestica]
MQYFTIFGKKEQTPISQIIQKTITTIQASSFLRESQSNSNKRRKLTRERRSGSDGGGRDEGAVKQGGRAAAPPLKDTELFLAVEPVRNVREAQGVEARLERQGDHAIAEIEAILPFAFVFFRLQLLLLCFLLSFCVLLSLKRRKKMRFLCLRLIQSSVCGIGLDPFESDRIIHTSNALGWTGPLRFST